MSGGRGGSLYRIQDLEGSSGRDKKNGRKRVRELSLYEPFHNWLVGFWSKDVGLDQFLVSKTASQGRRDTGGQWTRPDFAIAAVKSYKFYRTKSLEIVSFEIKPTISDALVGIYEAATHRTFAHRSYLAVHFESEKEKENARDLLSRIEKKAAQFEIGLIVFTNPTNWDTYETISDPSLQEPDPVEIDKFISQQFSEQDHEQLLKWI